MRIAPHSAVGPANRRTTRKQRSLHRIRGSEPKTNGAVIASASEAIQNLSASAVWIAHMGMVCVKAGSASFLVSIPGSSRFWRSGLSARSNSHSVVTRGDCTRIPLATGRLERTRPFFVSAFEAKQSSGSSTRIGRG